ncbi:NAD(P)H-dependent oxidoreductase [Oleidesulfovibrio sp.]|uniref:NAD(P)H-dependent oxidoreductase n=1 Tax=Oleidesulfovibrio sp. TaxID=2909707 RepID=UPI003A85E4CF
MNDTVLAPFRFRHASKDFDPDHTIPEDQFSTILEAGRLAPSSFGFEPWKFIVVQSPEKRAELHKHTWGGKKQIPNCSHLVVYLAHKRPRLLPDSDYIQRAMKEVLNLPDDIIALKTDYYGNFLRNDFDMIDNEMRLFEWSCRQTYIALANMMTAAAMMDIDSCALEGFVEKDLNNAVRDHLGVDLSQYGVACMCAFGYRAREPRPKARHPMTEVVEWM